MNDFRGKNPTPIGLNFAEGTSRGEKRPSEDNKPSGSVLTREQLLLFVQCNKFSKLGKRSGKSGNNLWLFVRGEPEEDTCGEN